MGVLLKDRKDLGCLGFLDETHPHDGLGSQKQRSESGWFSEPSNDKFEGSRLRHEDGDPGPSFPTP